ncbi:nitroreductase family protein [Vibrio ishigakensis]|nr:nitroreductase family protein [Vibrio ishigakensis]
MRNFTGESVKEQDLQLILKAAQQAPTSINAQQVSLVITRNKENIQKIAEIAGGQPQVASADVFITIVIDYHRTAVATELAGKEQVIHRSAEGIVVGAGDAGIMLNALQTAANSLGYGSTAIGGIRNNPQQMIDLLGLPEKTYPIVGITLGVADDSQGAQIKPRVPLESFAMYEKYDQATVDKGVEQYDQQLREWWDAQQLNNMRSYAEETAAFYQNVYFPEVAKTMQQQGFQFGDE